MLRVDHPSHRHHGGDIAAGITSAARWIAVNLPIYAIRLQLRLPRRGHVGILAGASRRATE
jgi:hypothetical protein